MNLSAFRFCTLGIPVLSLVLTTMACGAPAGIANPIEAPIPHGPVRIGLQTMAEGLVAPNLLVPAPGADGRLFIVDQIGQVRILQDGKLLPQPFLDVSKQLAKLNPTYDERGLLGFAIDPGFTNEKSPGFRRIFTYTSEPVNGKATFPLQFGKAVDHQSVLASWKVDASDPNRVDPSSRVELMRIDKPQMNHNAGMLAFGPEGYLYIALGDGGAANDTAEGHNPKIGNAQDTNVILGKILRIDVNGTDSTNGRYGIPKDNPFVGGQGLKEIFAYGLRNPWRFSFDGKQLIAADVGQNKIEEVDLVEKGKNYGWRYKEGTFRFNPADGSISTDTSGLPADLVDPIAQYDHDEGISITGGFVYRGKAIPELAGKYVFGDYSKNFSQPAGRLFYADLGTGEIREFVLAPDDKPLGMFVKGFGVDRDGEVYVLASKSSGMIGTTGVALKLVPSSVVNTSTSQP
ncbi:PQQ-dependent sugar dehydrogenase [Verrucomicrobiota bacterium sgz303538]